MIGTSFGMGYREQSTDFNVPDLIDKYIQGGNVNTSIIEGQNSFTVKSENIDNVNCYNDTTIPVVFRPPGGKSDWVCALGDNVEPNITYYCNSTFDLKDSSLQIGVDNRVSIDNRPLTLTLMYIIKLKENDTETPSGIIISYGGISVPPGYLLCDGNWNNFWFRR